MKWLTSVAAFGLSLAFAGPLYAETCELEITGNDQIQYDKAELKVSSSCEKVKVTLTHVGSLPVDAMGHNWVLSKTADAEALSQEGMAAGLDNNYLPEGDSRVIATTDMIGGGETTSVTFDLADLDKAGDYTFFCSFPGHYYSMNGKFIIE